MICEMVGTVSILRYSLHIGFQAQLRVDLICLRRKVWRARVRSGMAIRTARGVAVFAKEEWSRGWCVQPRAHGRDGGVVIPRPLVRRRLHARVHVLVPKHGRGWAGRKIVHSGANLRRRDVARVVDRWRRRGGRESIGREWWSVRYTMRGAAGRAVVTKSIGTV